ncbi:MAG: hypothetical protein A2Y10_18450 [Planctomycetes bacterium GWF2_41_51]|nr:MAG: hypothetical protein A2Y10_18450 [Planctomycetes bacterium GWF2_41_51]HBG26674.1 hypothetical protein [Phycisphaerales bacterium]
MNIKKNYLSAVITLATLYCTAVFADNYQDNGVFLGHSYVKYQSVIDKVPDLADKMVKQYDCRYWFVNAGFMDAKGLFIKSSEELAKASQLLNTIADYEKAKDYHFKVLAWHNGNSRKTDISKPEVRQNIVNDCIKLVSSDVNGSFISGSKREFDGICLDMEPAGKDDVFFENFVLLFDEISKALDKDKIVSACTHKYGTQNAWQWYPEYYYRMAGSVDLIIAMTYNSGSNTDLEYQNWMDEQTKTILQSVSGKYWQDSNHPALNDNVKVMLGFPGYPPSKYHKPEFENIKNASLGVQKGLNKLNEDKQNLSHKYFLGAAVYLYTDGTGKDNYSSETTDWQQFRQFWLKP